MLTILRPVAADLRTFAGSWLGRLTLVALVLVPAGYGGLYLYANADPYGRLSEVPAALVVEDVGATLDDGQRLDSGADVAEGLERDNTLGWSRVDRDDAADGLARGDYNVVLTLPADFSADLASSSTDDPRAAEIEIRTDDGNGYLARNIADQLVDEVSARVSDQVSRTATGNLLSGFAEIRAKVVTGADAAGQLATGSSQLSVGAAELADGQARLASGSTRLVSGSRELADGLADLDRTTDGLPAQTRELAAGARQVADGNAEAASVARRAAAAADDAVDDVSGTKARLAGQLKGQGLSDVQVETVLSEFDEAAGSVTDANGELQAASRQLDELASGADQVADGNELLAAAAPRLTQGIDDASTGGSQVADGAGDLASGQQQALTGSRELSSGAAQLSAGAKKLAAGLDDGAKAIPSLTPEQRRDMAQTISTPVTVDKQTQAAADGFAGGLAPLLLGLSLWVGSMAILMRLRAEAGVVRPLAVGRRSLRVVIRGWLAPATLGALQALAALAMVGAGMGLDVAHPVLLGLFLLVVSASFVAMVHALMARFGEGGQLVAIVLFMVQMVTAGGTFPWQTLPEPLQPFHHLLPMSYAVDGVRRLMYGGELSQLWVGVVVLAAWGVGALAVAGLVARRRSAAPLRLADRPAAA
ncbi:MAG: YhgE/Pip domain-containing protein [Dermatophilaceae bacterium]